MASQYPTMHVALPPAVLPAKLSFTGKGGSSDEQYLAFCAANPDLNVERTAQGEIVIVPPAGGESSFRNSQALIQLGQWASEDGQGDAFDSSVQFMLPDGSALSPDAAWVSKKRLAKLSKKQRSEFLRLCPEFVIEVMSKSDRLKKAREKMELWMANGVELGWLIHGDKKSVYVYRRGMPPEQRTSINEIAGEGPVDGLVLKLGRIWQGL